MMNCSYTRCTNEILHDSPVGRRLSYCSQACRQAAYRYRVNDGEVKRVSRRLLQHQQVALAEQQKNIRLTLRNAGAYQQIDLVDSVGLS